MYIIIIIIWRERRFEAESSRGPSAYQPNTLPLGQTGSHYNNKHLWVNITIRPSATPPPPYHPQGLEAKFLADQDVNKSIRDTRFRVGILHSDNPP